MLSQVGGGEPARLWFASAGVLEAATGATSAGEGRRALVALWVQDGDVKQPMASRPHMPGYGILPFDEGTGLLPWSWAAERLEHSHDYWLATCCADGRPHVMPVWAVWRDGLLWSSSALSSRKARNIAKDGRCTITSDDPLEPVVVEGHAEIVRDAAAMTAFLEAMNLKYGTSYDPNFLDPDVNATFRITPEVVFGLSEDDFTGSPTRWTFD